MANFFVPPGANQSLFQMTTDPKGSGSNQPFLHPWKMTLDIGQTALIGLSGGYDRGLPLRVTSNSTAIADHPSDKQTLVAPSDRILAVNGKAKGITMLEVRAPGGGEPWCFLQVEVRQRPGYVQGWIGPAGDADFNQKVFRHIEILKKAPSFQKMWGVILKTGYRVTILPGLYNTASPQIPEDSFLLDDGVTPGRGCSDKITYNSASEGIGLEKGNQPWRRAGAPYIALGHELVHCWMDTTGVSLKRPGQKERKATGLPPFADADFSENRFRLELGLPLRDLYD